MKEIQLTQGKVALVDDEDYEWLNQWKWRYMQSSKTGYAVRWSYGGTVRRKTILMHRLILDTPTSLEVDHIDHDGLNNQRYNIRNCTRLDNARNHSTMRNNTSGFTGVVWKQDMHKWVAQRTINKKFNYLGAYTTKEQAHQAYLASLPKVKP